MCCWLALRFRYFPSMDFSQRRAAEILLIHARSFDYKPSDASERERGKEAHQLKSSSFWNLTSFIDILSPGWLPFPVIFRSGDQVKSAARESLLEWNASVFGGELWWEVDESKLGYVRKCDCSRDDTLSIWAQDGFKVVNSQSNNALSILFQSACG